MESPGGDPRDALATQHLVNQGRCDDRGGRYDHPRLTEGSRMSGELPHTGFAIAVLGVSIGLSWMIGAAVALILLGVVVMRIASRDERRVSP